MAAGLVNLNILDGDGTTRTGRFWSSDGTTAGLLVPPGVMVHPTTGALIDPDSPVPVYGGLRIKELTPSIEATALDAGDVIFDSELLTAVTRADDVGTFLMHLKVTDKADQKAEMHIFLIKANVSLGTEDAAPSISDANSLSIVAHAYVASGAFSTSNPNGWVDVGGASYATALITSGPQGFMPVTGSDDIYVAAFTPGTPTFGATDALKLAFTFAD